MTDSKAVVQMQSFGSVFHFKSYQLDLKIIRNEKWHWLTCTKMSVQPTHQRSDAPWGDWHQESQSQMLRDSQNANQVRRGRMLDQRELALFTGCRRHPPLLTVTRHTYLDQLSTSHSFSREDTQIYTFLSKNPHFQWELIQNIWNHCSGPTTYVCGLNLAGSLPVSHLFLNLWLLLRKQEQGAMIRDN